ncbi:MAG TPA: PASTA domain-containing protein [Microthrixaceae bacterium]|nr:PASTA domain-containing protein [Microthrixaceae bacterium]HMT26170.1 PASTA domain-containing protein [Microthrixaceae bacterium]HMT61465.1 PASTA domain-containing protein [Microthrixaceae bacterium]
MSDSSGGDGWWIASDGKWYPPESRPTTPPPPPPASGTAPTAPPPYTWAPGPSSAPPGKPKRSTFKIVGGVVLALLVLGAIGAAMDDKKDEVATSDTTVATTSTVLPAPTASPSPAPTEPAPETTPPTVPPTTAAPPPATDPPTAVMPDVVCMNLQAAQDRIQEAGVFFSRSNDATGQGRMQIMDSNWVVVAQKPSPGSPVTEAEAVLDVVKIGEPGSC